MFEDSPVVFGKARSPLQKGKMADTAHSPPSQGLGYRNIMYTSPLRCTTTDFETKVTRGKKLGGSSGSNYIQAPGAVGSGTPGSHTQSFCGPGCNLSAYRPPCLLPGYHDSKADSGTSLQRLWANSYLYVNSLWLNDPELVSLAALTEEIWGLGCPHLC